MKNHKSYKWYNKKRLFHKIKMQITLMNQKDLILLCQVQGNQMLVKIMDKIKQHKKLEINNQRKWHLHTHNRENN